MTTAIKPYDLEVVQIREVGLTLQAQAEALVITDDEIDLTAKTVLATVTKGLKAAEDRRVEFKAPALAECQGIDDAFREATKPFNLAKKTLQEKTGAYYKAKKDAEDAALREQERIEREQIAERARVAAEAEAKGETPAAPLPAVPPPPPVSKVVSVTKTEAGNVGMVKHRGFRIVDESQIPRRYWRVDESAIAATYKAGGDVLGCEEVVTYTPRTR